MKRQIFLVLLIMSAFALSVFLIEASRAQNRTRIVSEPEPQDLEMAATIKRLTNRSSDGLVEKVHADGSVDLDLQERFQNVPLAALDEQGRAVVGCVATLGEANDFFGRDLETGRSLGPRYSPLDEMAQTAADLGMEVNEYKFYLNLIEQAAARRAEFPNAATLNIVNADGAGEGFNDPTVVTPVGGNTGTTLGQQRLNLFNFAAGIWGAYLDSTVPIQVSSEFNPQPCDANSATLGSAGTNTIHRDFSNATLLGTWYHQPLANKQSGSDRSPQPDMNARFNSNLNGSAGCLGGRSFYLGFDNTNPGLTINLLVVLLHEMGHGLGFSNFANGSTGQLAADGNGNRFPDVYTSFMFDRTANLGWNDMTDGQRVSLGSE